MFGPFGTVMVYYTTHFAAVQDLTALPDFRREKFPCGRSRI